MIVSILYIRKYNYVESFAKVSKYTKKFNFFKINIDREVKLIQVLNVQYLPEMIIFDNYGKEHRLIGEVTAQQILKLCQQE